MTTMNPDTGKHVSRLNKTSEWMSREVPELRIFRTTVWTASKSSFRGRTRANSK